MSKLPRVDTYLGPEMKSTGEVMGIDWGDERGAGQGAARGRHHDPAAGARLLLSIADRDKAEAMPMIRELQGRLPALGDRRDGAG